MSDSIVNEDPKGYYTIVAPGTIQSDYAYDVAVTVHEHLVPATIRVGISGPSYNESRTVEVNPSTAEIVHFDVPTLESGDYELQTEGLSGLIFKQHSVLNYKSELPKVYIQTDKAQYKPADLVQYRILALDENLKPAKLKQPLMLGIQDGALNKIKQIKDMKFSKGVYTGKFQLSEQPVLGEWTIEVTVGKDHKSKANKKFEVAKYVLPKFSVELETDKKVAILDNIVKITVRSNYTYGKPVKGTATITASINSYDSCDSYQSSNSQSFSAEKTIDIDGKGELEFHLMDDLKINQYEDDDLPEIHVTAVMTEAFTGVQQNCTTTISVERSRYVITVPKLASSYEINKPFEVTAIIKNLDGSPVQDALSTAKLVIDQYDQSDGKPVKGTATITASINSYDSCDSYQSSNSQSFSAEKTIDIDGKGELEFHLMDDLKINQYEDDDLPEIHVTAVMTEAFTGVQQNCTTTISVERSRYVITVPKLASSYEINKPFEVTAIIKNLDGSPVQDALSTAKLVIDQYDHSDEKHKFIFESEVDKNGVATFKPILTRQMYYYCVQVLYEEEVHNLPGFSIHDPAAEISGLGKGQPSTPGEYDGPLKLFPKTMEPKLGEDIVIDVKSSEPIPYFVYTVMGRGKILKHEYVKVDGDKKCVCIKINPTFEMAPVAHVYVYLIKDGALKFDETTIRIPNKFENMLEITAPEKAKPSDVVSLNIKTDPDSFVGLLGVDQSVLLLQTGNDLDEEQIFNDLRSYESESSWNYHNRPGRRCGLLTLTNASQPRREMMCRKTCIRRQYQCLRLTSGVAEDICKIQLDEYKCHVPIQPKIRKDFVESWIFDSIESTDSNGIANFTKKIPDTITSWVITGFSLNEHTGFGMTKNSTKIQVFQPFFLSTNLPYSIKRGEVITIPIIVFNYMESALEAEITMENPDREYDFTEALTEDMEVAYDDTQRTKKVSVPSNSGETVSFTIRPNIVGEITLMIKAITPVAGDAMHQKLKVEPEGVTQYQNEAFFITIPHGESLTHTLKADIPSDVVLDSEYLEFSAVGDILGPTIQNIDQLVRMPYGCGEQNMVNFVPNILVLYYLDIIKADMPAVVEKAKNYMEKGYQRELTYKHKDGAYSAFGEGSSKSNSWLTAYVARSFIQARKYITIDENIIEEALRYLITTQKPNGQFPQTGKLFYSTKQNEVGVSAFIMLALLEDADYALKYKSQIEKGLQYLIDNIEREDDIYTLALVALVFQKVKDDKVDQLLAKLELKSNYENNLKWWGKSSKHHNNNNIEITAYILQTLLDTEEAGNVLPIIKWLIGQRNSLGGFDSTQDTVVGLHALIKFAEKYAVGGSGKMSITFEAQDQDGVETTTGSFDVDTENSLLVQSHVLPKSTRQITLTAIGRGSSLVQLAYRYNMATPNDQPSFLIKHALKQSLFPGHLILNFCAEYKPQSSPDDESKESNMAVMEIYLPSGYTTDEDSLNPIRDVPQVQRVETKNSDTAIIVYFESLVAGQPICFDVAGEKTHTVGKLKPAAITVYDYYNTEQRATVYYEVQSSLCDIGEKVDCDKDCKLR